MAVMFVYKDVICNPQLEIARNILGRLTLLIFSLPKIIGRECEALHL